MGSYDLLVLDVLRERGGSSTAKCGGRDKRFSSCTTTVSLTVRPISAIICVSDTYQA